MNRRFSDDGVKLLVSSSIFNPASLPSEELHGKKKIKALAEFYGSKATASYDGKSHTSPPLINKDDLIGEWPVFKRALKQETKLLMERLKLEKIPSLQEVKVHMESTGAYATQAYKHNSSASSWYSIG